MARSCSREYLGADGIFATAGDPLALAQALLDSLSQTPEKRRGQGERLRQLALSSYSLRHVSEKLLQAYEEVCHAG